MRRRAAAAAAVALLAAGCAGVKLGKPRPVETGVAGFRIQEVRCRRQVVGQAEVGAGLHKVDDRYVVFHHFVLEPGSDGVDGRLGDWLVLDLETAETSPIRAPGFDPYFSEPAFRGPYMAYWAFAERGEGAERRSLITAARVYDVFTRRVVGNVAIEPPLETEPADFPYLTAPSWWDVDAVFRQEGQRWIVTIPRRR